MECGEIGSNLMVVELYRERTRRSRLTVPLLLKKMQSGAFQDGCLLFLEMEDERDARKKRSYVKVATYSRTRIKLCVSRPSNTAHKNNQLCNEQLFPANILWGCERTSDAWRASFCLIKMSSLSLCLLS